ncbi:hypothetical protein [Nocardioides nanhaiensis]|uniref:HK97 gp10 family phage protein n=1 Tax=Nocardioides nanhaiensis TaxID=1476871 RepID=A0ABP8X1I2_9ACTN
MSTAGFKVEGLNQVVRALQEIGFETDDLKDAFSRIAQEGAQIAAQEAPKRSGRLSGDVRGNRAKSKAVVAAGRSSVPYAGPINYGWRARGIAPNPFMQRTDNRMAPKAIDMLEDEINKQIRARGLH